MIEAGTVTLITLLYFALLFAVARYADYRRKAGRSIVSNAAVYVLSFGIWHTSWTFYGNVGRVATLGIDFLAIYLGVTFVIFCWWFLLRKMVRISKEQNIVSIADFLAGRYGKSAPLGALVAVFAVIATLPYLALQLKGVAAAFSHLSVGADQSLPPYLDLPLTVALLLGIFAILFGARTLDPSARHEGLVAVIALQSLVKVVALVAVGLFVCYGLFDGVSDLFSRFLAELPERKDLLLIDTERLPHSAWLSLATVSMMAFMCLPHLFHLMVVENSDEEHIKSAMWGFPLYMFLMELFIIPIALGGLILAGGETAGAEYFTLLLPLEEGADWLAVLVFIGSLSGSAGMVMVASVALSTLILNQLVMPLVLRFRFGGADISGGLLAVKRIGILVVVYLSYLFYRGVGESYTLVNMGVIAFVAATQFAPSLLGGLYWKGASQRGAWWGLVFGFLAWFYTLLLPSFVRSGWLAGEFLEKGPLGLGLLRPEALFGLEGLPALPHALFWSLFFNGGAFLLVSILGERSSAEKEEAVKFVDVFKPRQEEGWERRLTTAPTVMEFVDLMTKFIGEKKAHAAIGDYLGEQEIDVLGRLTEQDLSSLRRFAERTIAGSVGAAPARIIIDNYLESRGSRMEDVFDIFGSVTISHKAGREQLGILHEVARLVASGREVTAIFGSILELLQNQFRLDLCIIRLIDEEKGTLSVRAQKGMSPGHLKASDREPDTATYLGRCFLTGSAEVVNDIDLMEGAVSATVAHREGIQSFAHAPITVEGEAVGVLSVFSTSAKGIFTDEFMELFKNLTGQVGVAWRNSKQTERLIAAREQEREMQIARSIQLGLLPTSVPEVEGISLAGRCVAAKEVGGDYYDYLPRQDGTLDLVIADVSGHNVGAAFIMTEARTFIQARARGIGGPSAALSAFNTFFYEDLTRTEYFITMFYLNYDPGSRTILYASAGHNPPLLWRDGSPVCKRLDAEGLILGMMEEYPFEEERVQLEAGDVLLLYTDGITEAEDSAGNLFGEDRLCALLGELQGLDPEAMIEGLFDQVRLFTGTRSFNDDVSLVVMKVEG